MSIPQGDYRIATVRDHFVYRFFDADGRLLYVGCTKRPEARFAEHRNEKKWAHRIVKVNMVGPYCYASARDLERTAIATERPIYNQTPQRQSFRIKRHHWISKRTAAIQASSGVEFWQAHFQAVHEFRSQLLAHLAVGEVPA